MQLKKNLISIYVGYQKFVGYQKYVGYQKSLAQTERERVINVNKFTFISSEKLDRLAQILKRLYLLNG